MSANSKPPVPTTIKQWLDEATQKLQAADIPSARLDAELLLADALGKDRAWLIAHGDESAPITAAPSLERRVNREPIAYIRGHKEFYGRNFIVTPDTLIPRPETETIIELLQPLVASSKRLIDIGTGTGAIAISAKLEYPALTVEATDVSPAALEVATQNASALGAEVTFSISDLLESVTDQYDIICANLPYVDRTWQVSVETHFEPDLALYADHDGLKLIEKLIEQSESHLLSSGFLLLEADPRQHDAIVACGHGHGFDWYRTEGFIVVLQKR